MEKKIITTILEHVDIKYDTSDEDLIPISTLANHITELIDKGATHLSFDIYCDDISRSVDGVVGHIVREETGEELQARIDKADALKWHEDGIERREYERLKKKFED